MDIRDREKTMLSLKKVNTPILKGMQIYHDYFKQHKCLNGKISAEQCNIKIEGENKWLTVIQNASKSS